MSPPKLTIELVPSTAWGANLRSILSKPEWDKLRKIVYREAGYVCEVCGGKGSKWPVECHEVWKYDDKLFIQKLERMIALCPACHEVKHIGFAGTRGRGTEAIKHLAKVNGWNLEYAESYVRSMFMLWESRSRHEWTLDIRALDRYK